PQVLIVPSASGDPTTPVLLTCHVWGFYPPEVTLGWLRNGVPVELEDVGTFPVTPSGDWTYQSKVTLEVTPGAGDTFGCLVQHGSLDRPLLQEW
ncbi:DMB protein, partial [Alcedo cyanopectus]|nr:DMB protein [Ceyx cyanopectus]